MELLPVGNKGAERLDPIKERVVWPSCLTHLEFTREGPRRWWEEMKTHKICTSAWMMRILGSNQPDKDGCPSGRALQQPEGRQKQQQF